MFLRSELDTKMHQYGRSQPGEKATGQQSEPETTPQFLSSESGTDPAAADSVPEVSTAATESTTNLAPPATTSRNESSGNEEGRTDRESVDDSSDPLPLDIVFGLLSTERRRRVLHYLRDETESTTLGTLAEHIAALENDKPERALTSTERKRVYVALYQCHLPKLDDANVIDFEQSRGTVERGVNADQLDRYLSFAEENTAGYPIRAVVWLGLGVGSLAALAALPTAPWLSGLLVGCMLVLVALGVFR